LLPFILLTSSTSLSPSFHLPINLCCLVSRTRPLSCQFVCTPLQQSSTTSFTGANEQNYITVCCTSTTTILNLYHKIRILHRNGSCHSSGSQTLASRQRTSVQIPDVSWWKKWQWTTFYGRWSRFLW
jgi:hypothetical protein